MEYQRDPKQIQTIAGWLSTGSINVFGRPFSGKDTQAQYLSKLFRAPVIGGGKIIRNSSHQEVKNIIDKGELAPISAYLDIVLPYFSQSKFNGSPLILSSVGRWHGEEKGVMQALKTSAHELKAVILLDIDENEVRSRWKAAQTLGDRGRRADDAHGALDVRLEEFRNKTLPVIEFYRQNELLIEVDGKAKEDKVTTEILTKLVAFASAQGV